MKAICGLQVSTISKKSDDGRTISTRVIQGPVRGKKRMMRVMRDTPNGPELVAEVQVPGDCSDVNAFLASLPSLGQQRANLTRKDSSEHYDNVHDYHRLTSASHDGYVQDRQPNGGSSIPKVRLICLAFVLNDESAFILNVTVAQRHVVRDVYM